MHVVERERELRDLGGAAHRHARVAAFGQSLRGAGEILDRPHDRAGELEIAEQLGGAVLHDKQLFDLAKEWKTLLPGTERYVEVGRELIRINQENMTLIGTIGELPKPVVVKNGLRNVGPVLGNGTVHFNFGYMYPYRPDQWYKQ